MTRREELERLRDAVRQFVYETTCLSQEENNGSHQCWISKSCLQGGRAALSSLDAMIAQEEEHARAENAEMEALPEVRALLQEAREDLAAYVDEDYPPTSRAKYPDIQRRWHRDMELCRRIDAAPDAAQEGE